MKTKLTTGVTECWSALARQRFGHAAGDRGRKRRPAAALQIVTLTTVLLTTHSALGQGTLTPPGAPAPNFKTLQQIEPRRPISSLPFTITASGSYYLTTNLAGSAGQNGITIAASSVTLDLMGFELAGNGGAIGIVIDDQIGGNRTNICVRNGSTRNWAQFGILADGGIRCLFEDLRVSHNGGRGLRCGLNATLRRVGSHNNNDIGISTLDGSAIIECVATDNASTGISAGQHCAIHDCVSTGNARGFFAGAGCVVVGCSASANTGDGISAGISVIRDCAAYGNTGRGILASGTTVTDCVVSFNTGGGIIAGASSSITGCAVQGNTGRGIEAGNGSTVADCTVRNNTGDGIQITGSGCDVRNNHCSGNGGHGIHQVFGGVQSTRIDGNDCGFNTSNGVKVAGTNCLIVRNSAGGQLLGNFSIAAGNRSGSTAAPPQTPTEFTADPWANIAY